MDSQVAVFATKFYEGFSGDEAQLSHLRYGEIASLGDILTRHWSTDAHMALYTLPGDAVCPRLNKSAISWFQTQYAVQQPMLSIIAIDVDMPGHGEVYNWTNKAEWPQVMQRWYEGVNASMSAIPELATAGTYLTAGGLRFVWPLAEHRQIGVTLGDSYLRQFVAYLQRGGLEADAACTQWNRLFRLPFVVRDGQTQTLPASFENMAALDWAAPDGLTDEGPAACGTALREDFPETEPQPATRGEMGRVADRQFYSAMASGQPIAQPGTGQMHDSMMRAAASIVSTYDTNDPLLPFRFLLPSARAADYPESELWAQCVWCCKVHDGSKQLEQKHYGDIRHEASEAMKCAEAKVAQHLILATRSKTDYYVYNEEHRGWDQPIGSTTLLANKLATGCPTLFRMPSNVPANIVLQNHATIVDYTIASYIRDSIEYDPILGAVYEPCAPVDPRVRPEFNADIDGWLRALFASELEKCLDWLATLTRLDRPTCALYIKASPDVGKGLFSTGLARIWGAAPSKYEELLRNFQDGLMQCPLILADESVPEDPFNKNDSSVFRRAIGTGRQKIFVKHRAPITLEGFPRILITANNSDAIKIRDALEPADLEAIKQRVGYVETGTEAGDYLKSLAHTRNLAVQDMVEPWISSHQLANHVMWLSENRQVTPGDRFLVEGWSSSLTDKMAIKFGIAPILGKFIVKVIRDKMRAVRGVKYGDGQILVNVDYVLDSWKHVMGTGSRPPYEQTLMKALQVLSDGKRVAMRATESDAVRYYWRVDPERIEQIAEEFHLTDRETIEYAVNTPIESVEAPLMADHQLNITNLFASQK
jgi:hypothetical protein